jgi:hypothetical protein
MEYKDLGESCEPTDALKRKFRHNIACPCRKPMDCVPHQSVFRTEHGFIYRRPTCQKREDASLVPGVAPAQPFDMGLAERLSRYLAVRREVLSDWEDAMLEREKALFPFVAEEDRPFSKVSQACSATLSSALSHPLH